MRNIWAQVVCLAALVMLSVHIKVKHSVGLPRFNPADDLGYFKVESALQFRYASMAARGEPIPEVDFDAQYPEGIRTSRELPMLLENLTGWTWRFWPFRIPFDFRMFVILCGRGVEPLHPGASMSRRSGSPRTLPGHGRGLVYGLSWAATGGLHRELHLPVPGLCR